MLVSKAWFFRFFGIVYGQISFVQLAQINQFNSLIKNAKSYFSEAATTTIMTDSVIILSLNEVKKPSGYLYSDRDYKNEVVQVFNNLQNIQVLSLSWHQVSCLLCSICETSMNDGQYDDNQSSNIVWPHITQLHWLKICKETLTPPQNFNVQLLMKTYTNKSKPTTISNYNTFERPKYIFHLLRGAPMLKFLTLAFTASNERPWINTQYLEYIHQLCPLLHTLKLDNVLLYVNGCPDQDLTTTIRSDNLITEHMQNLELRCPVFYDFEQCILFYTYIKRKYNSILSLKIYDIRILISYNSNNSDNLSIISPLVERHSSSSSATVWENLEELKFTNIRSRNAFSICKMITEEVGKNGKLTYIFMSGEYIRKNKVNPIVVDLSWIQKFCPYLKTLDMNFIVLFSSSNMDYLDNEILFDDNNSLPITHGRLFRKLCLGRNSSNSIWDVQACKFDSESTIIKAITTS